MPFLALLLAVLSLAGAARAEERVTFPSLDGTTTLAGELHRPDADGVRPALVFLHGCGGLGPGGRPAPVLAAWARHLRAQGYVVLLVDSAGPRGFGATCNAGPERRVMIRDRPKDAFGALAYLRSLPGVRPDRIGIMGWSQGGGATLLAVADRSSGRPAGWAGPDFRAAVALYPGACNERLHEPPFVDAPPDSWRTGIPLLILQGGADNWARPEPCERFAAAAARRGSPVTFHVYPGAHHVFDAPGPSPRELPQFRLTDGTVPIVGTDRSARADALARVPAFLARYMTD